MQSCPIQSYITIACGSLGHPLKNFRDFGVERFWYLTNVQITVSGRYMKTGAPGKQC